MALIKSISGIRGTIGGKTGDNLTPLDVVDLGLSTTPTVEIAVPIEKAAGGIILTASHNPAQWNALKLLNDKGEFISGDDGIEVLNLADTEDFTFAEVRKL